MSKDLVIRVSRNDIRAAIKDAWVEMLVDRTPTEQEIDDCIQWLKSLYLEKYEAQVSKFVDGRVF